MKSIRSVVDLLAFLGLERLSSLLEGERLVEWLELDRIALLQRFKQLHVPLSDRQLIANGLAKAKREGRLADEISGDAAFVSSGRSIRRELPGHAHPTPHPLSHAKAPPAAGIDRIDVSRDIHATHATHVRVFAISDLHCDHPANMDWLRSHMPLEEEGAYDVCLCAGDVSNSEAVLLEALQLLSERFDQVFFTPGNHDMWLPRDVSEHMSSFDQLRLVNEVCASVGVRTQPAWIVSPLGRQDVLVVPLLSWYHASWDKEPELEESETQLQGAGFRAMWADFRRCRWGPALETGSLALAEEFAMMNEPKLSSLVAQLSWREAKGRARPQRILDKTETYALYGAKPTSTSLWPDMDTDNFFTRRTEPRRNQLAQEEEPTEPSENEPFIISMSHFVPMQELIPEKRMLVQGSLHKVSGSSPLNEQIRKLQPSMHIYGHTHLNFDSTYGGIRFVQHALGTPREQKAQTRASSFGFMCVYDGEKGGETAEHWTHWGRHYEEFERDITKTELAPYVKKLNATWNRTAGSRAASSEL
ncbi:hypothetical protein AB1Y20_010933 [Prymnesium parvum]|uniref:Calcineurin-like phosphoesterase domain-containing protein n=1 Tax=Prymnesium parvum TaxID=97485 RepID=A0AB34IQ56_PRYPA